MGVREIRINKKKRGASEALKRDVKQEIQKVWAAALEAIEIRFGDDFEGYGPMRKRILRVGNDAVRELHRQVEERYEVSRKPDTLEIRGREKENERD